MTDTPLHQGLRQNMVNNLRSKGITDESVLHAMLTVPRHCFIPESYAARAYEDAPLPINCRQTISQPYTVAKQSSLLEGAPLMKVLEIGTGSGYQAAILKAMQMHVYTIERHRQLYEQSQSVFKKLSLHIAGKLGDGYKGWAEFAPFDRILVTCGATQVPQSLLQQLKVNGIMIIPIGNENQTMTKIIRTSDTEYTTTLHGDCRFVPMLNDINM